MGKNKLSSVSKADSLEKIGNFWDTHDFTDFDTENSDVNFDISCAVPIEIDLLSAVEKQAKQRGVKVETLVNLWTNGRQNWQKVSVDFVMCPDIK